MNYQLCVYRVEAMQKWSQNCFAEGDTPWQKKKKKITNQSITTFVPITLI